MAYSSATELEKLLSNCEFENQQYIKLIEHEDQLIESLTKEMDFKEGETKRLQAAVSQLDEDTKQCHKQYTLNRDNLESLKKTHHVLIEHVAAMGSKMAIFQHKIDAEGQEHKCHLQKYKDIWTTYHDKYESLPLAVELKRQVMRIEDLSKKNQETETAIQNTKQKIEQLQGPDEVYKMGITSFIITLAKMRQETSELKQEIEKKRCELTQVKQYDNDRTNETTLQKLTDMHLIDNDISEERCEPIQCNDNKQLETQSPMISMLCDREDESEAMQTDIVPHDQINAQFTEENMMPHLSQTSDNEKQILVDMNESFDKPTPLYEEKAHTVAHIDVQNGHVTSQMTTNIDSPTNTQLAVSTMQSISQGAQLPFVAYKTKGPESVYIHLDKQQQQQQQQQVPKLQEKSIQKPPLLHTPNQPTLRHTLMSSQRPPIMQSHDRTNGRSPFPGYRPHIPQVVLRPTSQLRTSTPSPRPNVSLDRPSAHPSPVIQARPSAPQLYVPQSNMVQGSHLARPQLLSVPRSFLPARSPVVQSPRHTMGASRLPVLQSVRPQVSQLQRTTQLAMPNRINSDRQSPRLVQTSMPSVGQSPLQLSSPPVRLQSPQVSQQSPLQLPSNYQHVVQQKTGPQTISPSQSSPGSGIEMRSPQETYNEVSKTQIVSKASPTTSQTEINKPTSIVQQETPVLASVESSTPQIDEKLPQVDGTSTYYIKVKDSSENSNGTSSLVKSPGKPGTPEMKDKSLSEETFSPFDEEKHQKKLADMKKSPAQPNFYSVKRAFAEMEGSCQEVGNENMQFSLFGQASASMATPFDGSGDHTNTGNSKGPNNDDTTKPDKDKTNDTENQSAFDLFGVFGSSNETSECKSPGNVFNFGGGDSSTKTGSPGFSLFGSSNIDNDIPGGFSFNFGDNSYNKSGNQSRSPGGGNLLSMFGDSGNDDKDSNTSGFSFNFGNDQSSTSSFSFF